MPGLAVQQRQPGEEADTLAAGRQQLLAGVLEGVGFADDPAFECGDLIGADDQVPWMAGGEGAGFLLGQAFDQFDG